MGEQALVMLGGGALVLGIGALGVWAAGARRRIAEAYSGFAAAHGLQHEEGTRHVHGDIDGGRTFALFQDLSRTVGGQARRQQSQQVPEFVVRVELSSQAPSEMSIAKKGMLDGASPVVTGDATFDKKVYVSCPDPEAAKQWLSSASRREAVFEAVTTLKAGVIGPVPGEQTHDGFSADRAMLFRRWEGGYKPKLDWFEARFEEFTSLARRIDEGSE